MNGDAAVDQTGAWREAAGPGPHAGPEPSLAGLLSGLRACPGAWPRVTGQARWGTGVWMSAVRGARVERPGPVMNVASAAAQANAAAQLQLIWAKLDRNRAGSV
jgi:hypothetical protein